MNINEKWVGGLKDPNPMDPDELQPKASPPTQTEDARQAEMPNSTEVHGRML
jgi:hypothetical protein